MNHVVKGLLASIALAALLVGCGPQDAASVGMADAKKLLADAGYPNGQGFPKMSILYNTAENHKKIAEFIQDQWKTNLGIDVELVNEEWKTYLGWLGGGLPGSQYFPGYVRHRWEWK